MGSGLAHWEREGGPSWAQNYGQGSQTRWGMVVFFAGKLSLSTVAILRSVDFNSQHSHSSGDWLSSRGAKKLVQLGHESLQTAWLTKGNWVIGQGQPVRNNLNTLHTIHLGQRSPKLATLRLLSIAG
uniref:Uncharacterized protein n=1 Tax=Micrurus spixii TaxID=129469 RepID=A0A2D4M0C3_9SAUR